MRSLFDRAPFGLPAPAVQRWEVFYRQALSLYGEQFASFVATKLVFDMWSKTTGRPRPKPLPGRMTNPGNLVVLDYTLQIAGVRWGGSMIEKAPGIDGRYPLCLWSERLRAVLTYPALRMLPTPTRPASAFPEQHRLYRTWRDGKEPRFGASRNRIKLPRFTDVWAGAVVVYKSDKFDKDGEFVTYIHHLEQGPSGQPGPLVYVSPDLIMVRGGKLRLTKDGLAG